ncbi:hypothetical protein GLOTRDRAFT_72496 [Gloeophyllum trabeum ATCC 11539]|uniref:DUF4211 domain-containing protein n=1 Tax=Gloeophyllum trabeum (strain ATCC 11539 / FP-39264 / Madison 617) TaxID=670483 RepID=S7QFQ3_GLOTA|nr:uncharacterized protein GLOTRDRAFT_72496 [Gloeophyllum trabeum ATCC 11539]EPQ58262.1 hypothetical protein GLOTRDRAFT_72496 [Gloeophyllum trabeum ATCC 11539]
MPRRKQAKPGPSTPKKLKQTTLFVYALSSSPQLSPKSSPRKKVTEPATSSKKKTGQKQVVDLEESDSSSSAVGGIRFEPEAAALSDDVESEESPRRHPAKKRKLRHNDSSEDEDSVSIALNDIASKHRGQGKQREGDGNGGKQPSPEVQVKRRRLVKGRRPVTPSDDEDEDDLLDELDTDTILEDRFRSRGKKSAFQINLEKLKRLKRGLSAESPGSSESTEENVWDEVPFEGARPSNKEGSSDDEAAEEDVDDSFVVEDDSQTVAAELPSAFSMNTYQDLAHHFKIICQLFVHVAVRPAEERQDYMQKALADVEYFSAPLHIARRKLTGMRDSLVASSVWRPEFKGPLEKYPNFELVSLEFAVPACDACHLGGRMSTYLGRVSGQPYDRLGFEPLTDSDSDDSEDEEESKDQKEFHLGRFCARRTKVFHEFSHWEYSTYQSLLREVEELRASKGKRGFIRVAFSGAGGVKPPEDLDDADQIMEWLDQRQVIEMEWWKVKDMMARARNLEMASKRGEDTDE